MVQMLEIEGWLNHVTLELVLYNINAQQHNNSMQFSTSFEAVIGTSTLMSNILPTKQCNWHLEGHTLYALFRTISQR